MISAFCIENMASCKRGEMVVNRCRARSFCMVIMLCNWITILIKFNCLSYIAAHIGIGKYHARLIAS